MKQLFSLIFAGIIGGLVALGGAQYFNLNTEKSIDSHTFAKNVNQTINIPAGAKMVPFDFANAAEIATKSVVHIRAAESKDLGQQRRQDQQRTDPFGGFFDSDFFTPFDLTPRSKSGTGSGVIYSQDGYIVTNNHVVGFADEVEVTLYDNRIFTAKIVGTYPQADLAVLKIEAEDLPILKHANSDAARVGEWVLAVGNPLELNSTVTAGIISAKGRNLDIIRENNKIESFIQTDAVVNPGNSGGALVDAQGQLLGINTAIKTQTGLYAGYSFAIPVNLMEKIVNDIIEYGDYQRAFLGINIFDLDNEYATENNLDFSQGVVIDNVVDGGSAQYAGLLPGDIIIGINNKDVHNVPELQAVVGSAKVGETISVKVNRNGKIKDIEVYLKNG